jgi:hypothetical protein
MILRVIFSKQGLFNGLPAHDIVPFGEDFLPRMDTDSHGLERGGAQCLTRIARMIAN